MSDPAERAARVRRWVVAAISLATIGALAAVIVSFALQTNGQRLGSVFWERHSLQVQLTVLSLRRALDDAESAQRGYLLVGDDAYLDQYRAGSEAARLQFTQLRSLTSDNASQRPNMDELAALIEKRLAVLQRGVEAYRADGPSAAVDIVRQGEGKQAMEAAEGALQRIEAEEGRLLTERTAVMQRFSARTNLAITALSALGALLLALAVGAVATAMRASDRARMAERLKESAEELAKARDFLQLVIDNSIDPIYVKDRDGRFVLANASAADLHGASKEEIIGKRARDFLAP